MYIVMIHLKLVNLFVEEQVILPGALTGIESEILCCINIFCQNHLVVQGTELTINMNCGFDSFEPDTLFFLKSDTYILLSMSGNVAGSIPCMSAKNFNGFKHKIRG